MASERHGHEPIDPDPDAERREQSDEPDAGIVGGGGPAGTLPEQPGPGDEDLHRADTDHRER